MTFVFLVRGDFCKPRPFSLKARPALVPHSQRGWRGHPCTGGLQPSVSLPAGVRPYVQPTPAPAASNNPLVLTPCSTHRDPAQGQTLRHLTSVKPPSPGEMLPPTRARYPLLPAPYPPLHRGGCLHARLGAGPQLSTPLETLSPPSSHPWVSAPLPSGHVASPLLTARLPHCGMAGGPRGSLRTVGPLRGQPCSGRRRLCSWG